MTAQDSAMRFAVIAPMVAIKTRSGATVQLLRGQPVAGDLDEADVGRLTDIGMIGMVPTDPPRPVWPPAPTETIDRSPCRSR
jgi:hypothetical protein